MTDIIFMLRSRCRVVITGDEPERFLNLAAAKGIYISDARPCPGGLRVKLSRRALDIVKDALPEGLEIRITDEYGAARFFRKYRGRILLLGGIPLAAAIIFAYTQFVWRVTVTGGTPELQKEVAAFMDENGLRPGTPKRRIDQKKLKKEAILAIDDLMWLWVEIKGAEARISVASRDMPPEMADGEPSNVIALETGVIEKMTVTGGEAVVGAGDTVEKGGLLISGVILSENEGVEPMIRHAAGSVIARTWREKAVLIPKVTEKRTYTGNVKKIKSIKIKKFIVNFSLNSSILYPKYDKIRTKYTLGKVPAAFISDEYREVKSEYTDTDLEQARADVRAAFEEEIAASGAELVDMTASESDRGDYLEYRLTAQCLTDIAKTVPLE